MMVDLLLSRGAVVRYFSYCHHMSDADFSKLFMRSPVDGAKLFSMRSSEESHQYLPFGWYGRHRAEIPEWQLQHSLRAEIAAVAATAAALEEGTAAGDVAVDGVVTQSLGTHFALVVLRDIVLRQLRVDLRESHERVPGLGAAEYV